MKLDEEYESRKPENAKRRKGEKEAQGSKTAVEQFLMICFVISFFRAFVIGICLRLGRVRQIVCFLALVKDRAWLAGRPPPNIRKAVNARG